MDDALNALFGGYLPVLIATITGFGLVITALIATRLLAPFSAERQKGTTYECGMLPIRRASTNVGMRFYLFAILFIIFDVEALFLFPWALVLRQRGWAVFWAVMVFFGLLLVGFAYVWLKGGLDVVRRRAAVPLDAPASERTAA